MFKSLVRTLPSLIGNAKLSLKLNEYVQDTENVNLFHVYVKNATIDPLQNNIYNHDIKVNLLEGSWEYDISRFYRNYFEKFYDKNYEIIKDDYLYYDPTQENINYRNKDYEFGCKRNSYFAYGYQFSFFAPIYITDVNDIPDYFDLHISIKPNNEKIIRIHFGDDTYINKYLSKYLKQIDEKVIFILNETKRATYFGIDVEHGGLVNIVDNNINYIFNYQTTINNFDKIINDGFVKNKIVIRQILPISFDFNIEDILSKIEYKQYSFFKLNKIYGNYVKNYDNLPLYDFDIDYQMMEVNGNNVMSNNTFYSLQEAFLNIYKYDNKVAPKYNKWKLSLSNQYDPYYFNINLNFNDSYDKYSKFPRLNNTHTIDIETHLYNDKININQKIKEHLINGTITKQELNEDVYEKYVFKRPIYVDEISDELKSKLGLTDTNDILYNYIDLNNLISTTEYKTNQTENITGWFDVIDSNTNIFSDNFKNHWTKCLNNYAYFKGILYDFNNYVIDRQISHLDYFSIFFLPSYIILGHSNDLFMIKSLFKRSKDDKYNYNFGINTIPLNNFINPQTSQKNNLFNSDNLNTYLQTNNYIQHSEFNKDKSQYCIIDKYIENKFIDINTFINIISFLLKSISIDTRFLEGSGGLVSEHQFNIDLKFFNKILNNKSIFSKNAYHSISDVTISYLGWLLNKILTSIFDYNDNDYEWDSIRDFKNDELNGLKSKILFDQYVLVNNIFYINNILSKDQSTFLNYDGNGIGDKSQYIFYKYKYDNSFKNLYEFPIDINNISENTEIEFYIKKNLINISDLYNYLKDIIGSTDQPDMYLTYHLSDSNQNLGKNNQINGQIIFDNIYNFITNKIFNSSLQNLMNLYPETTFYYHICYYYNLLNLNYYNFNNENNIYFTKNVQNEHPIYVDVTNFMEVYGINVQTTKKYIYIKNLQQFNFIKELIENRKFSWANLFLCMPSYFDNYHELKKLKNLTSINSTLDIYNFNINTKYLSNKFSYNTNLYINNKNIYIKDLGYQTKVYICLLDGTCIYRGNEYQKVSKYFTTIIDNITHESGDLFKYRTFISNKKLLTDYTNKGLTSFIYPNILNNINELDNRTLTFVEGISNLYILINNENIFETICEYYNINQSNLENIKEEEKYTKYILPKILDDIYNERYQASKDSMPIWNTTIIGKFETTSYLLYQKYLANLNSLPNKINIINEINQNNKSFYLYSPIESKINDNYDLSFFTSNNDDSLQFTEDTIISYLGMDYQISSSYIGDITYVGSNHRRAIRKIQLVDKKIYLNAYYNNFRYFYSNDSTDVYPKDKIDEALTPIYSMIPINTYRLPNEKIIKEGTKTNIYQINNSDDLHLYQTTELLNEDIVEPIYNSPYYIDGENDYQKTLIKNGFIQFKDNKYVYRSNPSFLNNYAYELSYSEIIELLVEKIYNELIQQKYLNEDIEINHPLDIQAFLFKTLYNLILEPNDGNKENHLLNDFPKYFNIDANSNSFLSRYFEIENESSDNILNDPNYTNKYYEFCKYFSDPLNIEKVRNNLGFKNFIELDKGLNTEDKIDDLIIKEYIEDFYEILSQNINLKTLYVHYDNYFNNLINNCRYIFRNSYTSEDIYETIDRLFRNDNINTYISSYITRFESFDTILRGNGLSLETTLTKSLLNDDVYLIKDDTNNIQISQNEEQQIKEYKLSLLNIIYSIISLSAYYIYCIHSEYSQNNFKEYGSNDFYGYLDYIKPLLDSFNLSNSEINELTQKCNYDNTILIKSKKENCIKVIKFGIRMLLLYLYNYKYDIFKRIIIENLGNLDFYEISNYKRIDLLSFEEAGFDVNKLYNYKFVDNTLNTFDVGGKTYGCYIIKSSISNSQNTFNLTNSIYFDHIKKDNQYYQISDNILNNFTEELLPLIKYNLFDEFNRSFDVYNPVLLPEKFILSSQYIVEKNTNLTNSYILNNDISKIVIDSFNTKSEGSYKPSIYKLKKYYNQNLIIHRYTNFIEPTFIVADVLYLYNMKYKNTKSLFGNDNIYRSYININKYEGIPLFSDKDQKYLFNSNHKNYDIIKEIEYKSFNDNQYYLLVPKFEINFNKYFTYDLLLEYEQKDQIIKYFTNYIQKFNSNSKLDENEILFLFNKYKVTFISNPIKLNLNKTKKLYTLKYIFTLL